MRIILSAMSDDNTINPVNPDTEGEMGTEVKRPEGVEGAEDETMPAEEIPAE